MTLKELQDLYPDAQISSTRRAASFRLEIEALVEPDLVTGIPTQADIEASVDALAAKIQAFRSDAPADANQPGSE